MAARPRSIQIVRRVILGFILVGFTALTILHQRIPGIPAVDALDPFGGLETLMKLVAGGELLKRIQPGTLVLLGAVVALGLVLSRFFCGWFCAFGALQGVFGWLGRKIFRRRFSVPPKLDAALRWLKYFVLIAVLGFTWIAGELVIRPYDPLAAYAHLWAGPAALWAEFAVGSILLALILVLSLFFERAFCRYLCPLGAFNAILGRIPLFRIRRNGKTCISCRACDKACPMAIDVSRPEAVDSPECIACLECVSACPTEGPSLRTNLGGKALSPWAILALGLGIYLAAAGIGAALGALDFTGPSLERLASEGRLSVTAIKGSDTYEAVSKAYGVDLDILYRTLGLDLAAVPPSTMLKDTGKLAGLPDFEADEVRVAVARLTGEAYAGEGGGDASPEPATSVRPAPAAPGAAAAPAAMGAQDASVPAPSAPALAVPKGFVLEGTMSVADVARELGAEPEAVIGKLGLPADLPRDRPLRELKDAYGFSLPELKKRIAQ